MQFQSLICIFAIISTAWAQITISENTVTYDQVDLNQLVVINGQVFWSIWDNLQNILDDFQNNGEFYLSANDASMSVQMNQRYTGSFENTGTVMFNAGPASTYELVPNTFQNDGDIFFVNLLDLLIAATTGSNTKSIVVGQDSQRAYFSLGLTENSQFDNSGDIYLVYSDLYQIGSLGGNGCVHINQASTVVIQNPTLTGQNPTQIYYMVGSSARIMIEGSSGCYIIVAGFGDTNAIYISEKLIISNFSYKEDILSAEGTVDGLSVTYTFRIGRGYLAHNFEFNNYAFRYLADLPNPDMPSSCNPAPQTPIAPASLPQSSSSSEIASSTSGSASSTSESVSSTTDIVSSSKIVSSSAESESTSLESVSSISSETESSIESQISSVSITSNLVSSSIVSSIQDSAGTSSESSSIENISMTSSAVVSFDSNSHPSATLSTISSMNGISSSSDITTSFSTIDNKSTSMEPFSSGTIISDYSSKSDNSHQISSFANSSTTFPLYSISDVSNESTSIYNLKSTGYTKELNSSTNEKNSNTIDSSSTANHIQTSISNWVSSTDQYESSTTTITTTNSEGKLTTQTCIIESGTTNGIAYATTYLIDTTKPKIASTITVDDNGTSITQTMVVNPEAKTSNNIQTSKPQNAMPSGFAPIFTENSGSIKTSSLILLVISYLFI